MTTHAQSSDQALAALALVEASASASLRDLRTLLSTTSPVDLLFGMTTLVTSLTQSLAAVTGVHPSDITELLRSMLYVQAQLDES